MNYLPDIQKCSVLTVLVLSQIPEAKVQMEGLYEGMDLNSSVTRARFEGMNGPLFSNVSHSWVSFLTRF